MPSRVTLPSYPATVSLSAGAPLARVVDEFVAELDEIESIFAMCRGHRSVHGLGFRYRPTEDGCLVSIWDAWTRFLRRLVLTSASGVVQGLSGATYSPVVPRTEPQALLFLNQNRKGQNFRIINGEPKWSHALCLVDIANTLGVPNGATIISATTASFITLGPISIPSPLEEIRVCRNFIAHKNDPNLRDVAFYSPNSFVDFQTHLRQQRSGVETFSEWAEAMVTLAESAAQ